MTQLENIFLQLIYCCGNYSKVMFILFIYTPRFVWHLFKGSENRGQHLIKKILHIYAYLCIIYIYKITTCLLLLNDSSFQTHTGNKIQNFTLGIIIESMWCTQKHAIATCTYNILVSWVFSFSFDWRFVFSLNISWSLFSSCSLSESISSSFNCSSFSSCDTLWSLSLLAASSCVCSKCSLFLPASRSGSLVWGTEKWRQHNWQS